MWKYKDLLAATNGYLNKIPIKYVLAAKFQLEPLCKRVYVTIVNGSFGLRVKLLPNTTNFPRSITIDSMEVPIKVMRNG